MRGQPAVPPNPSLERTTVQGLRPDSLRVVEAGGKIHVEEQEVPGMGAFSLFTDPEGRMMGLWKTKR